MLVLSRRVGERLVIGKDIVVSIIDVRSDGVRIGIDAPREVRVTRAEILEAVERQNAEAAAMDDSAVEALKRIAPPQQPQQPPQQPPPPQPQPHADAAGADAV
ncbi:carbon storage regulator CsrA [Demequina capsici]|uniref:Translational regulator CsrA n=1 Tax=Demequina capsici TaxID=3075620 RepID=A0AA96FFD5_9MICO|nr:carbon storage regulator CsrA [Demequina sp. PMTSA13]WNM27425.1 carbon storage regulator CsrA [Demequina sp. PMTSA13]